jgi:hypothetical protein
MGMTTSAAALGEVDCVDLNERVGVESEAAQGRAAASGERSKPPKLGGGIEVAVGGVAPKVNAGCADVSGSA